MKFDLGFTQRAEWLGKREDAWRAWEDVHSEGLTRKQLGCMKDYFLSGILNKGVKPYPTVLVTFFPAFSKEAMEFIFKEYVVLKNIINEQDVFRQIQADASLNLDYWPGADREEKIGLFKMFFGEVYDPSRKFPFLVGEETEYRDFPYTAGGFLSIVVGEFVGWCRCDEEELQVWPDLVDFMLSIIPHAESWMFKQQLSEVESKTKLGGLSVGAFCRRLEELMQYTINPPKEIRERPHFSLKQQKLQQIGQFLDGLETPKELVEHWQWAKQKFASE